MKNPRFKTVYLLLLLFFSFGWMIDKTEAQNNDWQKEELKGKVKSIKEIQYRAWDTTGMLEKGEIWYNGYRIYNEKGNLIEKNEYKANDSLRSKTIYKYDNNGKKTEWTYYTYDNSIEIMLNNKYDKKGNCIEVNNYYSNGSLKYKQIYKYDNKGNKIEYEDYYPDSSMCSKTIYKYFDKGRREEIFDYNSDDSFENKAIYLYDEKGNYVEEQIYNSDGSYRNKLIFKDEFDANGNWIKQVSYWGKSNEPEEISEREIIYY